MAENSVLKRIDRTLDRIDARLERGDRRWEEDRKRWEERDRRWVEARAEDKRHWAKRDRELRQLSEENRRYMDALLDRHARITADQIAAIEAIRVQGAQDSAALQAEIADQRSEIKAHTAALLKLIDRLPPGERPQG